ncbi:MAG: hypothetical protein MnENMB40S_24460 [Rhizobiaceae bacterium MnEN-MB40S]|nr:MAG: hypothetical protein MnENMB40S_24460 [Rhizobiaceae bacterium MnEN-MB40S]
MFRELVFAFVALGTTHAYAFMEDSFNKEFIDKRLWQTDDVRDPDNQIEFSKHSRCGPKSIRVTLHPGDPSNNCDEGKCERVEIRNHRDLRQSFFSEESEWYGFSFKVGGYTGFFKKIPRVVVGQWKQPYDDNPVLAQRYSDGFFRITTQDGPVRVTIASQRLTPDDLQKVQSLFSQLDRTNKSHVATLTSITEASRLRKKVHTLDTDNKNLFNSETEKFLADAVRQLDLEIPTVMLKDDNSIDWDLIGEIDGYEDLTEYFGTSNIDFSGTEKLPDPAKKWVDMTYRILPGRSDYDDVNGPSRSGEFEIWANGKQIVTAKGDFGYPGEVGKKPDNPTVYFKFGVYRDPYFAKTYMRFDDYKHGQSRSSVQPDCPPF